MRRGRNSRRASQGRPTIRIPCPICGERDRREFYYRGSGAYLDRPETETWSAAWDAYLHRRSNTAGAVDDLWCHEGGCGAWLVVQRDTVTHEIIGAVLARNRAAGSRR